MVGVGLYVIIKPIEGVMRTTSSGLDIPTELGDRFIQGDLISASEDIGKKEFGLEGGQVVLYDKFAGHEIKGSDGETYKLITCRDIAVVL